MARILIVEDNPDNMFLTVMLLQSAGYTVLSATDAEAGLILARAELPDLILMDIQLPVIDGYEATRRIRAKALTMPIIGLSAHAMSGDAERALSAGCTDYLTKPLNDALLFEKLDQYLNT